MPTSVLSGLRVLDLSDTAPGAQCTQILSDFGADVLHVEQPGGSPVRASAGYAIWGRGKTSLELDLWDPEGAAEARRLSRSVDIVVSTFQPGVGEQVGLDGASLTADNPALIHLNITGFGTSGPLANLKGYEGVVAAKAGIPHAFRNITDRPGPTFVSTPYATVATAHTSVHAVLAALFERERTGRGQSLQTNMMHSLAMLDTWNWFTVMLTERYPEAYSPSAPYSPEGEPVTSHAFPLLLARTADGRWLQFAQQRPHLFKALLEELGLGHVPTDPYWRGFPEFEDQARRSELWRLMLNKVAERTLDEWLEVFSKNRNIWAELLRSPQEVFEHPQLVHDGRVVEVEDPELGFVKQLRPVADLDGTPGFIRSGAPRLGEGGKSVADEWVQTRSDTDSGNRVPAPIGRPPLEGVTILELGMLIAAPFAATLLGELGARVIKVEPITGDPVRHILPFPEAGGVKVLQGKESIAVDIRTEEGRAIVHRLAARSDLVIQSFRPEVASRLGIDVETLRKYNPNLVYLSSQGYGVDGPCADRAAFANTIAVAAGIAMNNSQMDVNEAGGLASSGKVESLAPQLFAASGGVSFNADGLCALGCATGALLVLLARERGLGAQVASMTMLATTAVAASYAAVDPDRDRTDTEMHGLSALYRLYETAEGWVFLAAPSEHEWSDLLTALSRFPVAKALSEDPRFDTDASRAEHDDDLGRALAAVFTTRTATEWESELASKGIGCVAVTEDEFERFLMNEGHEYNCVTEVEHPTFDKHPRLTSPYRFSRSSTLAGPGCLTGQHTDDILRAIGCSDTEISDLRTKEIVN